MSAFLVTSELLPRICGTVVMEEIDRLSKSLMSSRHIFQLRKLKPRRKPSNVFKKSILSEENVESFIIRIFSIFNMEKHFGLTNCSDIANWVMKVLNGEDNIRFQNFVYKEAPFATAFRAKTAMKDVDPRGKRKVQQELINHIRAGLGWWVLAALKQVMVPMRSGPSKVFLWRRPYLKVLKKEFTDFKLRYRIRRAPDYKDNIPLLGTLKFTISHQKLRPIFKLTTRRSFPERMHWKRMNAMIGWCLERNGISRPSILDSCRSIHSFLLEKSDVPVHGFVSDVTKCFSTVNHKLLIEIINRQFAENFKIYSVRGQGRDKNNRFKLFFCCGETAQKAKEKLRGKMKANHVDSFWAGDEKCSSSNLLRQVLISTLSSYYFKRGEQVFKVTKGVPQGHPLSSSMAHIYLSDFERKYWGNEQKDERMLIRRYEDDYLLCTTDEKLVEKMLKPLYSGRNEHKITANRMKSRISGSKRRLMWCGVRINFKKKEFARRRRCADGITRRMTLCFPEKE